MFVYLNIKWCKPVSVHLDMTCVAVYRTCVACMVFGSYTKVVVAPILIWEGATLNMVELTSEEVYIEASTCRDSPPK